jgi:hypothetical protein
LRRRLLLAIAAGLAACSLLAGPSAYALSTISQPASGSIPVSGPSSGGNAGGGAGGGLEASASADSALISYLEAHRNGAQYLVAAFTSNASASIIIASDQPVITIGGFNGADPAPTLAQFEKLVAEGKVRYVLVSSGGVPGGGGSAISQWVTANGTQVSYGSGFGTLYDVSAAT